MTLRDWLPNEYNWSFEGTEAYKRIDKMLNKRVVFSYDSQTCDTKEGQDYARRCQFRRRYIYTFAVLDNGYAVGWNENPSIGWSFELAKVKDN